MNDQLGNYRYGRAELHVGTQGQVANRILLENRKAIEPQAVRVRNDLYCLMGISISNTQVVVGRDGLVVVDTGKSSGDGERILELAAEISDKPIVAVVYTHSHYTMGTSVILERYPGIPVIAHHKVHRNVVSSMTGPRRFMRRRGRMESAQYLPNAGEDAPVPATRVSSGGAPGYVPPTTAIEDDGAQINLGGISFVFHTRYPFDTNDTLLIWLPEQKAIIHNHFASNFPNVYPIQGGHYRNPEPWLQGIDLMRAYAPEHILGTHGNPDSGSARCTERLTAVRDGLQFVHDQTIRGMNKHLTPRRLLDFVQLPEALLNHPDLLQTYGEVPNHVRGVFSGLAGWFDGDAASIQPPEEQVEAQRVIEAFGGVESSIQRLYASIEVGEYAWAARIGQWLLRIEPDRTEIRHAQAAALRRLGQVSTAWTVRNYYLSQARELEGFIDTTHQEKTLDLESALLTPAGTFVRALGYRAAPEHFPEGETVLKVQFSDVKRPFALALRRGVAEFLDRDSMVPSWDVQIRCSRRTWIEYVDQRTPVSTLVDEPDVAAYPDRETARAVLNAFD